ncbi:MYXO-CTERM sorting domain-containing protein [Vitiosangium sp. GDMCC 1.1324]|uniref:MYXO-CTERM sorting domain-containing protein n=1 Tax=Vitiosangium sp. (strain GDMCC 1.1324) TaxID=2138576 RepID=UPI000D3D18E5|nr:MYXO-CTERM sorting domain-containing protein [Vitiosangium sp. GDMCC 1.1324]PTL77418.1 hypothetical protein DAT35_44235 [Vitiosangium sp. GDMCC 1.1324]
MWRGLLCSAWVLGVLAWGPLALASGDAGVPFVGTPCSVTLDCNADESICLQEIVRTSGSVGWEGGYCSVPCGSGGTACPSGSTCVATRGSTYCLKQCQPDVATACREDYICEPDATAGNVCIPTCVYEADCQSGFTCRICDGRCIPKKTPGVSIGDACTDDAQCGTGQVCLKVNGHPQGICSQPCGTGACSSCPDGSTCQQVGSSKASMCVSTCSRGTCDSKLQCAPFPGGTTGCLPPCRTQADCPAGATCGGNGQCLGGSVPTDAGCSSCGPSESDAGTTPITPAPDAGPGSGGTAGPGCGCQGSSVNAPGFLGALALFFVAARRRRCQRP